MAQAAASYSQTPQQQMPPGSQPPPHSNNNPNAPQHPPNGLPFNTASQPTPSSAAYPHQPALSSTPNPNHKFPIPKTLHLDPRLGQQAVPTPAARPTMGNSGMLAQPGLARPPTFTLEGEGDHVLSKRKLDELVRQ
ncbi:Transcription initiation factor TFIID subunit 12, partial [Teratosphaeriaceae sp. CCFEE 6253]